MENLIEEINRKIDNYFDKLKNITRINASHSYEYGFLEGALLELKTLLKLVETEKEKTLASKTLVTAPTISNTIDCFRWCIGKKVLGFIFEAVLNGGLNKTLILDDRTGLTISSNGSFWIESKNLIDKMVSKQKENLSTLYSDIEEIKL